MFAFTLITSLTIPSSLIDLKEGCFLDAFNLRTINVSPNHPRYKMYDDRLLIKNSTNDAINYDSIAYCLPYKEEVTVPNFIKHIDESILFNCVKKLLICNFYLFYRLRVLQY